MNVEDRDRAWERDEAALAELLSLDENHPRRRALAGDPRFQAAMTAFRAFLSTDVPPGARTSDARSALSRSIDQEVFGARARDSFGDRLRRLLATPGVRPALSFAVVGFVFAGVYVYSRLDLSATQRTGSLVIESPGSGLRSGTVVPTPPGAPVLLPPGRTPEGGVLLRWRAVTGADAYAVKLYTPAYTPLAAAGPRPDTVLAAPAVAWPKGERETEAIFWTVTAMKNGVEISTSPVGSYPAR